MSWRISTNNGVAIVYMNTNTLNKQNINFYDDFDRCFDTVEKKYTDFPLVLTSEKSAFSAGIDIDYWLSLVHREDQRGIDRLYYRAKSALFRLFSYRRPTIAAINGNAYASGMMLALSCDYRIAAQQRLAISMNEVSQGVAVPAFCIEIIRYAVGTALAKQLILRSAEYTAEEAFDGGIVDSLAPPNSLVTIASRFIEEIYQDNTQAYAFSKYALQAPYIENINGSAAEIDSQITSTWLDYNVRLKLRNRL